jgi:hypothetical protein
MEFDEDLLEDFFTTTIEAIEDKILLDKRNIKYITQKYPWEDLLYKVLDKTFGFKEFRQN